MKMRDRRRRRQPGRRQIAMKRLSRVFRDAFEHAIWEGPKALHGCLEGMARAVLRDITRGILLDPAFLEAIKKAPSD